MGTPQRIWFPCASYHITARGNHRNNIFRDEEDFEIYLKIIEGTFEYYDYQYELICYCLMTNHIHFMVKTKEKHISFFMRRVNGIYARYFNNKYNYIGHLFQERYYSELIENDAQALEISRYIHLNPVKAKMVQCAEEYKWSSYSMYIGMKKECIICSQRILNYFKDKDRELYKQSSWHQMEF